MSLPLMLAVGAVVIVVVFVVVRATWWRGERAVPATPTTAVPADLEPAVRALIDDDRKIEAIKLYRERTGAGLKDAKEAVEAIAAGAAAPPIAATPAPADLNAALLELLRADRKIDAIKLYRERTGAGLREAKDAVDALSTAIHD